MVERSSCWAYFKLFQLQFGSDDLVARRDRKAVFYVARILRAPVSNRCCGGVSYLAAEYISEPQQN